MSGCGTRCLVTVGVGPAQGQFVPPWDYSQFVPWNAGIVGALIRAVTAAHRVLCCCVTATLCGCAAKASLQMFAPDYFNPHNWQTPKGDAGNFSNEFNQLLQNSHGAGWHFVGRQARGTSRCLQSSDCPVQTHQEHPQQGLIISDKEQRTHLLFKLHMLFNFPHKEIHVNVLSHSCWVTAQTALEYFCSCSWRGHCWCTGTQLAPQLMMQSSALAGQRCCYSCRNAIPLPVW